MLKEVLQMMLNNQRGQKHLSLITGRTGSWYHGGGGHCLRASTFPGSLCRAKSLTWHWAPTCTEATLGTATHVQVTSP